MIGWLIDVAAAINRRVEGVRLQRRWERLRAMGMVIGEGVNLPASTAIDTSHCYLISIGDYCGFGPECMILAHDGQFDEFMDAGRIGRVVIHPHSHIGARTVVLAGVEIGPRTIVGAGSVVTRTLPADSVCAGNPAKVICGLEEYLDRHREQMRRRPTFPYVDYETAALTPERRARLVAAVSDGDAYLTGGWTLLLRGGGDMRITELEPGDTAARHQSSLRSNANNGS